MEPIHIMRVGRHVSQGGNAVSFSQSDLQAIAANYDPALHEAPIVVGHPVTDSPAFGWIGKVTAQADGLYATPSQVQPEFTDLVRSGVYKKVSASFFRPDTANNPRQGTYYLRHLGFLGATPPAVKGLRAVSFSEGDDALNFQEDTIDLREHRLAVKEARLWRSEVERRLQRYAQEARILFADVEPLTSFIVGLSDSSVVDFADADEHIVSQPHREWMLNFLERRPPLVTTGMICTSDDFAEDAEGFSAPPGYSTDPRSAALLAEATQYMRKNGCGYSEAVRAVAARHSNP